MRTGSCESGPKEAIKQAKSMKHQPQNTEIKNTQLALLCAVGYSVLP
jgi:hypothetical protein